LIQSTIFGLFKKLDSDTESDPEFRKALTDSNGVSKLPHSMGFASSNSQKISLFKAGPESHFRLPAPAA
jgi:hypothetical protein